MATPLQLLSGVWTHAWSQGQYHRAGRRDMHSLSYGALPLIARSPRIDNIRQVINAADKWVMETADVLFDDDGFRATWTATGDLTVKLDATAAGVLEYTVAFKTARLLRIQGIPAEFAAFTDRHIDMERRAAHKTVIVLTEVSRIDRDDFGEMSMMRRM